MNILGTLFRLVCSWLLLVVLAVYLTASPQISPSELLSHCTIDTLQPLFSGLTWVTITALVLLVLALLRIQEMIWNVCFAAALLLSITFGACFIADPASILPDALQGNRAVLDFCYLPKLYPIPATLIFAIFAMGWLCSTAPFRIMFTCVLSYALWYGCAEVFHYMIGTWAKSPEPSMPELLHAAQSAPWISAAIPGAFFLVYALLMSFIETFISRREEDRKKRAEAAAEEEKQNAANETAPSTTEDKPATAQPADELPPVPAVPTEVTPAPAPAAKPAEKAEEKASEITEKPAEKAEEKAPEITEKPAEKVEEKVPETTEQPAEKAEEKAPETTEKPAEKAEEKAPEATEKSAEKAE